MNQKCTQNWILNLQLILFLLTPPKIKLFVDFLISQTYDLTT